MFAALPRATVIELTKFVSVGLLNTLIAVTIIYSLKWGLEWSDVSANLMGYLICIVLGFVLNARWTFGRKNLNTRYFVGYLSVATVAYLMNLGSLLIAMKVFNVNGNFAQIVGVPVFTLSSFAMNKIFLFPSDHSLYTIKKHE